MTCKFPRPSFPSLAVAIFGLLAGPGVSASQVTLDLDRSVPPPQTAVLLSAGPFNSNTWSNSYQGVIGEQGFEIGFQVTGARTEAEALDTVFEQPFVSDCQGCVAGSQATVDRLTFARPDGNPFSLTQIAVARTDTRSGAAAMFIPFDANGNLDYGNIVYDVRRPGFFDNLVLKGVTTGGATVRYDTSTFALQAHGAVGGPTEFDPTTLVFGADSGLSDLVSLTLEISIPWSTIYADHLRYLNLRGEVPDAFLPFLDLPCAAQGQCVLDGVGLFDVYVEPFTYGNWATAAALDSFSFDVRSSPAPVPLPATGVLALAALGGLGLLARVRRRL